jgi:hypothetical protein
MIACMRAMHKRCETTQSHSAWGPVRVSKMSRRRNSRIDFLPPDSQRQKSSAGDQKERGAEQINIRFFGAAPLVCAMIILTRRSRSFISLHAQIALLCCCRGVIRRSRMCVCVYYLMRATAKCCTPVLLPWTYIQ